MKKLLAAFVLGLLLGTAYLIYTAPVAPAPVGNPPVVIETLDASLLWAAGEWREEIGRRFSNAVGIHVHGSQQVDGVWCVAVSGLGNSTLRPAATVVREVQARYPGRTVVLLACNPGHMRLGIRGVYYATADVWLVPDRAVTGQAVRRSWLDREALGNIFEFVAE